jgi:hypothetical protein
MDTFLSVQSSNLSFLVCPHLLLIGFKFHQILPFALLEQSRSTHLECIVNHSLEALLSSHGIYFLKNKKRGE